MNLSTHLLTALIAVTLSTGSVVKSPKEDGAFELLILHNNDMHARFEQTSQRSGPCTADDREAGKCYGGFARVAHVVKEARKAAVNGEGPPVLYLNAGDTYTGTAWFTIYKWKIAAEFINALKPDAVSLGNDEFDKTGHISPLLENIDTKILASNVIVADNHNENMHKSVIFDIEGVKVGIIGYLTPNARILKSYDDVEYIDELVALQEEVINLQQSNVNIIIALGHSNPTRNLEIAKEVDGIDFVIAGYKNSFFWNGTTTDFNYENIVVTQNSGKRVPIIYSSSYNKYLGKLYIKFNKNGQIISYDTEPIVLDQSVPEDIEALELRNKVHNEVAPKFIDVVGNTVVTLDGDSCGVEECNFGNFIADAIMYYNAVRYEGTDPWTDAPIAIIHSAAIAGSIEPLFRPGPITLFHLSVVLPRISNVVAVTVSGTVLKDILEHAVADYNPANPSGRFLQYSGIRVEYDLSRDIGSRVVNAMVRCGTCFIPQYFSIDDWRSYTILMPEALADGEYGYTMFSGLDREYLEYDEFTSTAEYIELRSPVYPEVANRVVIHNAVPDSATALVSTKLLIITLVFIFY